jgi:hypothetical protein
VGRDNCREMNGFYDCGKLKQQDYYANEKLSQNANGNHQERLAIWAYCHLTQDNF